MNCIFAGNMSSSGAGVSSRGCSFYNCTLTANSPDVGIRNFGTFSSTLNNCIVYYNVAGNYSSGVTLNYCCAMPDPGTGIGNFTNEPLFLDMTTGNLRPQSNSPCINAGRNSTVGWVNDLDGNLRIVGGTVDLGAYEFQSPGSVLSYAWAQQYGLPTDGSADFVDADGDGMNNWQEWRSDTVPTDALSVLKIESVTNNNPGLSVTWQSVNTRAYRVERSTDFGNQPPFLTLKSNIAGQSGTTSYTDTNAVGSGPFLYRVGVQ